VNTEVPFKMGTGAEVMAISDKVYQSLGSKLDLQEPTKTLLGPACQKLKVLGQFKDSLSNLHASINQSICVIQELANCLFGLPGIVALQLLTLLKRKHQLSEPIQGCFQRLKDYWQWLPNIKEWAKPHTLHTPKHVPILLKNKVLNRMEAMEVISKIG